MTPIADLYCQLHPLKLDAVKAEGLAVLTNTFYIVICVFYRCWAD